MNDLILFFSIALLLFGSGLFLGWYLARKAYIERVKWMDLMLTQKGFQQELDSYKSHREHVRKEAMRQR